MEVHVWGDYEVYVMVCSLPMSYSCSHYYGSPLLLLEDFLF